MKNLGKLAALGAALAVSTSFAHATQLGSYGTGDPNMGNANSALNYAGFVSGPSTPTTGWNATPTPSSGTASTFNIGAGSPWANALANSSWVSYTTGTNPSSGPAVVAPQGYYTFTTTFSVASAGSYGISLNVLADDTTAIYFNNGSGNVLEYSAGPQGDDGACSDGTGAINCENPTNVSFGSVLGASTTDTLTFVVEQTGYADFGLDFNGTVAPTPEPSSLMLLGTGLTGAAGMFFRRRRNA